MPDTTDVVIIGGGAAGCSTAYFLARAGVKSTIVEVDAVASQASGYAAGQLSPLWGPPLLAPFATEAFQRHVDLSGELIEQSGVDFHPKFAHLMRVGFDETDTANLKTLRGDLQETLDGLQGTYDYARDMSISWLDAKEVRAVEPRLAEDVLGGVDAFGFMTVDPYQHTLSVFVCAEKLGASLRTGKATGLKTQGPRVTGVVLKDGEIECDSVVIAMGPWAGEAGEWLRLEVPIEPVRGELLHVDLPGPPIPVDVSGGGGGFFPRSDGLVRIGSTRERRGFDRRPDASVAQRLLERAVRLMPAMEDARLVRQTVCLRPTTPDDLPLIGRAPGWDNAYLATGGTSKGILLGLGIGEAITDLITTGGTKLPVEPFSPARFA